MGVKMIRKILKHTDLEVSSLCLGTVNYGTDLEKEDAKRQLDIFTEMGGNFLDTAHVYGDWVPGERNRSERVIGEWLKESGKRNQLIISTKGAHPLLDSMHISRVNSSQIKKDLDESLKCLGTDVIDLYFLHRDNKEVAVGDILECLEEEKRKGNIRFYGCSNWSLHRILEAENYAKKHGLTGFVCDQLMWSLAEIKTENLNDKSLVVMNEETYKHHKDTEMNVMAYMAIAKGYFTKRQNGVSTKHLDDMYNNERNERILQELNKITKDTGIDISSLSIAFMMAQEMVTIPIISFRTHQQLEDGINSSNMTLNQEIVDRLNKLKNSGK